MAGRPMVLRYAARSDVGLIRGKNDDSAYAGQYLAVVADGMGGHAGGDVASASTVLDLIHLDRDGYTGNAATYLADEIQTANSLLSELVRVQPTLAGMGTTVTALLLSGEKLEFAHIGDSRAYRLKDGVFEQVSVDHTYVQRLIDEGRLRPEDAETHPHKNVLMRVLGDVDASPELDLSTFDAAVGERWLLCSDGLNFVPAQVVEDVVRHTPDLGACADKLIELTLAAGSPDNVTVVLFEVAEPTADELATASLRTIDAPRTTNQDDDAPAAAVRGRQQRSGGAKAAGERAAAKNAGFGALSAPDPTGDDVTAAADASSEPPPAAAAHAGTGQPTTSTPASNPASAADGGQPNELGTHISADVVREELAARPHELVGAALSAAVEGTIPAVAGRAAARRAATVLTHKTAPAGTAEADEPTDDEPPRTRRTLISIAAGVAVVILVLAAWLGYAWTQTRYYLGDANGHVAIYIGVSQSLGPVQLSHLYSETGITVASLPDYSRQRLQQTVPAAGLDDARQIIIDLQLGTGAPSCPPASPSVASSASPSSRVPASGTATATAGATTTGGAGTATAGASRPTAGASKSSSTPKSSSTAAPRPSPSTSPSPSSSGTPTAVPCAQGAP
ncbi:serine/threonine-protein phosphatase [Paenarthrobacter sp. Z7-10]|uniref:PP2C family protein-serine/threonine phosphatase n=1 Tax=Paenarthrobacter sp. Z7-10 TaxID=2787635 RepID=UPI0022A930BB|nr:protein phosphatase 2C domain-containing protein [Paenarthrobacter sp. Z7-10]MCZ2403621.1 serine/threonine-protein phosphatase [Paenarthrobacter sp. Z7-10]